MEDNDHIRREIDPDARWLSAICYVGCLVLVPIFAVRNKTDFLAGHCRQGFALFFAEIVALVGVWIVDATIGVIPIIGLVISFLLHLVLMLVFLGLSVVGFIKALSGETWRLAFLESIAERVPVHSDDFPHNAT